MQMYMLDNLVFLFLDYCDHCLVEPPDMRSHASNSGCAAAVRVRLINCFYCEHDLVDLVGPPEKHSHAWNSGCAAADRGVIINWLLLVMLHVICGLIGTCIYVVTYFVKLV